LTKPGGVFLEDECCLGFIPADQGNSRFVCVNCGDGECLQYEDEHSCLEDCFDFDFTCPPGLVKEGYGCVEPTVEQPTDLPAEGEDKTYLVICFILLLVALFLILFYKKKMKGPRGRKQPKKDNNKKKRPRDVFIPDTKK
jgi:hypothetical protein